MAQVSCLLYKHKNLNSDPQYPQKKLGMADVSVSSFRKQSQADRLAYCAASVAKKYAVDSVKHLVSKERKKG